jgi:carbon-monoxide dehydrogenase large subunit
MTLFGTRVTRVEDAALLTGSGRYVADLDLPGAAWVTYVTSTAAHARVTAIELDDARRAPGVLDVVTADDLDIGPYPPVSPDFPPAMARPLLATGVVRFVGEPIVAIVSETAAAGADAAELVAVDLDPLPAVVDVRASLQGEVVLFPEAGTNVVLHASGGNDDFDLDACEVVVRATLVNNRVAPCPMETRVSASRWEPDGRLTHWSSCQGVHPIRAIICRVHGLEPDRVRVISPEVGGSFGAKARAYPEEVLLPWLARRVSGPVRWIPPRSVDMVGLGHSRAQIQRIEIGGRRDGEIEALRVRLLADAGAYPLAGPLLPRNTGALASGVYRIPHVHWQMDAVATNTTPTTAYRGAGRPEAAAMIERAIDLFAHEIGTDPVQVRRRNMIRPNEFPYITATGVKYDSGDYERGLDLVLRMAGIDELRAEQATRRESGDRVQVGIGLATFLDRTAGIPSTEYGSVELLDGGRVRVLTGSNPYGQGHHTSWAMLVADRTGIPMQRIEVVHGDTDIVPRGAITGGSRSVQRAGAAVAAATDELVDRAREVAADMLEAAAEDVVLALGDGGRFHVAGVPARTLGWSDVAAAPDPLRCEADVGGDPSVPSGAYIAVVDVDVETGRVGLRRFITVDDAGRILNPLLAEGQVHGGAAQGIAQALWEEFRYDEAGNPLTSTFATYDLPSAAELPSFESALVETPSPSNPLGAKGIAESGTIGAPPAVQNAVVDALSHLGVTHIDMPCTPERVWRAIRARAS